MNLGRYTTLVFAALILCMIAAPVQAYQDNSDYRGRDFSQRQADNGEFIYRCATDESGPKRILSPDVQAQIDRWLAEGTVVAGGVIPVHVHVIYTSREGNISDADIAAQIQVLNDNYSGRDYSGNPVSGAANTGYSFTLASVDRTNNSKWFKMTPGSRAETQAKSALSINPGSSLNLFTCKPGQNLLGWSVFPWMAQAGTNQDGVVIHYGSFPNGYLSPYNLGGTSTHEIGHYLGLYHTFQGGCDTGTCDTSGDLVCDTPAENTATSGCPEGKDTCPATGLDPIHNYMDYSTDACYTNFTTGQDTRMNQQVLAYTTRSWIGATRHLNAGGSIATAPTAAKTGFRVSPNPFNPRTKIEFSTVRDGHVSVRVYDVQGRLISTLVDRELPSGTHSFTFDGDRLASGIYWLRLEADGQQSVKTISLLK